MKKYIFYVIFFTLFSILPLHCMITHDESVNAFLAEIGATTINNPLGLRDDTPLHMAIHMKKYSMMPPLISCGADINLENSYGNFPLFSAIQEGDVPGNYLQLLINKNILETRFHGDGSTVLHLAATQNGYISTILLKAGATIDSKDYHGNTPLLTATYFGNFKSTIVLVEHMLRTAKTTTAYFNYIRHANNNGITTCRRLPLVPGTPLNHKRFIKNDLMNEYLALRHNASAESIKKLLNPANTHYE